MEATAAFVFSSGGVVRVDELSGFFQRHPEVLVAVLAAAAPLQSLKKIVLKVGAPHGLFWRDDDPLGRERGAMVAHVMTAEQIERGAFEDAVQWVPRSLLAVERHVRALPGQLMKTGAIVDFYSAYPLESAFMKRRCRGIVDFVQHYDPQQRRIGWDSSGNFCVQPTGGNLPDDGKRQEEGTSPLSSMSEHSALFARLQRAIHAEVDSSFARTRREDLFGEPAPEPQSHADGLDVTMVPSFWSKCAREISILPRSANELDEVRAALSVHTSSDDGTLTESDFGDAVVRSPRRAARGDKSTDPALHCEVSSSVMLLLDALRRVNLVSVDVRATPTPHPLAHLIMAELPEAQVNKPRASFLLSSAAGERPVLMTLRVLAQINTILLQVRTTPSPHPLAFLFIAFERRERCKRSKRVERKSRQLAESLGSMYILIPKATREILSFCGAATATAAQSKAALDTNVVDCTSLDICD